jgi:hypothetical protein
MNIAKYRSDDGTNFGEAYTGNPIGRRGIRTPLSNSAPKESLWLLTTLLTMRKSIRCFSLMTRGITGNRGQRAWHVGRGVLGTWEAQISPKSSFWKLRVRITNYTKVS